MTEQDWQNATKAFHCKEIAKDFGNARKLRLLMVGFLEPLHDLFSEEARGLFLKLREWAESETKDCPEDQGQLRDYMERTPKGLASAAVSWIVNHGSQIEPHWTYSIAMPTADVCSNAAQALVLKKVGKSPQGVSLTHPSHQEWSRAWNSELQEIQAKQADLMRCVYGNPFRPVTLKPTWLSSTVSNLAAAIYADRAFDRLPILADALEDAGCDNQGILNHCRQPGQHCRGCWVVDLVLGKE